MEAEEVADREVAGGSNKDRNGDGRRDPSCCEDAAWRPPTRYQIPEQRIGVYVFLGERGVNLSDWWRARYGSGHLKKVSAIQKIKSKAMCVWMPPR